MTSPLVTAFCAVSTVVTGNNRAKLSDQQRYGRRHVIVDPAEGGRKLAIETGYDSRIDAFLKAPLEPWDSPVPNVGKRIYAGLVMGRRSVSLADQLSVTELAEIDWMLDARLVGLTDNDIVVPLSDPERGKRRAYPGSGLTDRAASIGRTLRSFGPGLVLAGIANGIAGVTAGRGFLRRKRNVITKGGLSLTAYELCTEVNKIIRKRADLAGYRFMSVDTCRRILRALIRGEQLTELEAPRAVRRHRSWVTLPRIIAMPVELLTGSPPT